MTRLTLTLIGPALLTAVATAVAQPPWPRAVVELGDGPRTVTPPNRAEVRKQEEERRWEYDALPPAVKSRIEAAKRSVAVVRGTRSVGSGFVVGPGLVATNSHVIAGELIPDVRVSFVSASDPNPKGLWATLVFEDRAQDLALLAVQTDYPPLPVADPSHVTPGLKVAVIGNPAEFIKATRMNSVSAGKYLETVVPHTWSRSLYRFDAYAEQGNSGGPVICQETGAVVGVVTWRLDAVTGRDTCCVPAPAIRAALRRIGPEDGWAKRAEAQAAIHAAALVHAQLADSATETREAVELAREMLTSRVDPNFRSRDGRVMKGTKWLQSRGEQMRADARRMNKALAALRGSKAVPERLRGELTALQVRTDEMAGLILHLNWATYSRSAGRLKVIAPEFEKVVQSARKQLDELDGR